MGKLYLLVLCAALLACLGLAGALWWQSGTVDGLSADNARLERNLIALGYERAKAREAAEVAAARAGLATKMNAAASAKIEAIRNLNLGECSDAPLNPDLADIIGRGDVPAED